MDGDMLMIVGLIAGGVAIFVAIFAFGYYYEKKRTTAFREAAETMGLSFNEQGDSDLLTRLQIFQLFQAGRSKKIRNMVFGDTGDVKLGVFDYQYTTGHGKNSKTSKQSVLYVESSLLNAPNFALSPQHFFHSIASFFGYQDINFDTHPKFSSDYILRGADEEGIRQFFQAAVLDYFEQHRGITVEANGGHLLFFRAGQRINADKLTELMDDGLKTHSVLCGEEVST